MQRFAAAILSVTLLSLACSDDAPTELEECSGNVTISVGAGTEPEFSWTPACRLFSLIVETTSSGSDQWSVITPGANSIEPPVGYGTVPAGATELTAPAALASGTEYRVILASFTGPDEDDGELLATENFTP